MLALKSFAEDQILQDSIKENDPDLNENYPIVNKNSDFSKDKNKTMSNRNTKTKGPTTVIYYGHTLSKAAKFKKHVVVKHFSGARVDDMKHDMKPTQVKSPAQIIFDIGTNALVTNKDFNKKQTKLFSLQNLLKLLKTR